MNRLLATEITNFSPPSEIAIWLACAAFSLWILLLVDKGIGLLRGKTPEPPNGELKQSIKQLNARMKNIEDWRTQLTHKLEKDKIEILQSGELRSSRLHEHIEKDRLELDGKIERLPERIINTLVSTGALRRKDHD